ncbi:PD-(D/E)XK nuclease domain-containing protein, partial [Candidatus Symbiothrix dinenymphae]|uniref:PD-(D/E)XK nuclease domain-containing protein n=1 Tax=Candidatus Symbiothrix dinenymphae TaxID=467085 RepID=UPI000A62C925
TPTFLINRLKKHGLAKTVLEPVIADSSAFDSYDPDALDDVPLLFQTGYLTVKNKEMINGEPEYTLGVPNQEVRVSLMEHLLSAYTNYPLSKMSALGRQMLKQILAFDAKGFTNNMRIMLADVPYTLKPSKAKNEAKAEAQNLANEAFYHIIFQLWMTMLGFNIQSEKMTNRGRIDAVLQQDGVAIVTELK